MRRTGMWAAIVATGFLGAGLAGSGTLPAQKTFERPTADTGPIDVRHVGPIEAKLLPPTTVGAMQVGLWSVAVEGRPEVQMAVPAFIRRGESFRFRWTPGEAETYRIVAIGDDGWVLAELAGVRPRIERWLNPTRALSIERVRR